MKRTLLVLYFISLASVSLCQTAAQNCTQILRTARSVYEQGRLHELPELLQGCLNSGFSKTEKVEAHRLLVLTYIYLEEPEKADLEMINLLQTERFFVLNQEIDPIEFQNLHDKYRWWQVARVGFKVGFATNHFNVQDVHPVWAAGAGKGTLKSPFGFQIGLLFEKDLKNKWKKFTLAPEVLYSSSQFTYTNESPLLLDEGGGSSFNAEHIISQTRFQANVLLQYQLRKNAGERMALADNFIPYVAFGPSISYLSQSMFDGSLNVGEFVTGAEFQNTTRYKPIILSIMASIGFKFRLGDLYIGADIRYAHGLQNVVKKNHSPYEWQEPTYGLADYGYADNDFRLSQSAFNVAFIYPIFSVKRLRN